jgi:hypothetical protein
MKMHHHESVLAHVNDEHTLFNPAPHKHIALACVEITFLDMCAREMHTSGDDVMAKRKKHLSQHAPKVYNINLANRALADLLDPGEERNKSLSTLLTSAR